MLNLLLNGVHFGCGFVDKLSKFELVIYLNNYEYLSIYVGEQPH